MSFDPNAPVDNVVSLPECTNNQGESLNDSILQKAGWLHGYRMDDICGPRVSARQVALYVDGATAFVQDTNELSTETIVTSTKRETNYVHRGWSMGAIATVSPWTLSRIAARNHPNAEGTWYTKLTKAKRLKVEVMLEDLVPVPEFKAAIENALEQPTTYEKFQAIYCALDRWGDVVPLEIEIGSSLAMTDTEIDHLQFPETGERNFNSAAGLSTIKTADITVVGDSFGWNDGKCTTEGDGREFKSTTPRHGGTGGSPHQFVLEDGEHIVTVSGWHGEQRITQLCFGTNRGRTSEVYGAGKGQSFSSLAPRDKDGNYLRLQYICGKGNDSSLTGVMFVWTPC
ncbi:unnamed protein product [Rhizoctonia solani]|uniref:Jacalin-type lectin domain-containing protein n=1 Tax=Rhizoctonia solani TaxID=456999 RepID=A0A8H3HQ63_9AGAM|nr:unnamed protein product [Rhizoctonia solani]